MKKLALIFLFPVFFLVADPGITIDIDIIIDPPHSPSGVEIY